MLIFAYNSDRRIYALTIIFNAELNLQSIQLNCSCFCTWL